MFQLDQMFALITSTAPLQRKSLVSLFVCFMLLQKTQEKERKRYFDSQMCFLIFCFVFKSEDDDVGYKNFCFFPS